MIVMLCGAQTSPDGGKDLCCAPSTVLTAGVSRERGSMASDCQVTLSKLADRDTFHSTMVCNVKPPHVGGPQDAQSY